MNWKKNGIFKVVFLIILFSASHMKADVLEMYFDHVRFLDGSQKTTHNLIYKIPNSKVHFVQDEDKFLAAIDVEISIIRDNEKVSIGELSHYIGALDINTVESYQHYYLDMISLTLEETGIEIFIDFKDRNSERKFTWSGVLESLPPDSMLSDIEFSHNIVEIKDEDYSHMDKFIRGDNVFYVDPSHIYDKGRNDRIIMYYEIQNVELDPFGYAVLEETFRLVRNDFELVFERKLEGEGSLFDMVKEIPIKELDVGYYTVILELKDLISNKTAVRESYVVVKDEISRGLRMFADKEEEFRLIRYFLSSQRVRDWDNLSDEAKANYIYRFWSTNDPNPLSEMNEFYEEVRYRIEHANKNFTHHQEGWKTDKGRIYIRNGEPSEIESGRTDIDTRLGTKDFKIWKFRNTGRVYLFVDLQGNGNYRLIYVRNDDLEHTLHDWLRYVGTDFDMSKLE